MATRQAYDPRRLRALIRNPGFRSEVKDGVGELYIYDIIGESWWSEGVTAQAVAEKLEAFRAAGVKKLSVFINSPGGDVFDGSAIYAQIERFDGEKTVHVDGLAASAASFIAMAGDRILTARSAMWMVHNPWTIAIGDQASMRETAEVLEKLSESIAGTYAARTKRDVAEIRGLMDAETWMTAEDAQANGFSDGIDELEPEPAEKKDPAASVLFDQVRAFALGRHAQIFNAAAKDGRVSPPRNAATTEAGPMTPEEKAALEAEKKAQGEKMDRLLAMAEAQAKRLESVEAQLAKPVGDLGSQVENAARGVAPMIAKWGHGKRLADARKRFVDADKHQGKGLGIARCALAVALANRNAGMSVQEAAKEMGFAEAADAMDQSFQNAMTEGSLTAGGALVPEEYSSELIDLLAEKAVVRSLMPAGAVVQMKGDTLTIPKITGGPTSYWLGEGDAATNSNLSTGLVTLNAKKMATEVLVSRDLLRDAAFNVDAIVRAEMVRSAALKEDLTFIEGDGSDNEPRGLKSYANSSAAATSDPGVDDMKKDLRAREYALRNANVAMEAPGWILHPLHRKGLECEANAVGAYPFEEEMLRGTLRGYPFRETTQISTSGAASCVYLADFAACIIAEKLAMEIEEDTTYVSSGTTHSASARDQIVLRLWRRLDFAVRHAEAVTYLSTVTWGA